MTIRTLSLHAAVAASILSAGLLAAGPALAHADHGKPMYGGVVAEAGAFQGELVASPKGVVLYITEHGAPVPTAGASGKMTVLAGDKRSELELAPAGDNRLAPTGGGQIAARSKAVATVKLRDGRTGVLRFEVK